jgi:thiol-disulfide isomerase/thioredoxin
MKFFNKNFFIGLGAGLILMIIIIIGARYFLIRSLTPKPGKRVEFRLQPPPIPTQTKMDYNWCVQGPDGEELDIGDIRGKIVFLNFWATWCLPCIAEMPCIQRLYDSTQSKEIVFMCVSDEDRKKVNEFVKENKFTLPLYSLVGEKPQIFQTRGIPATFVISRDGQIVFKHVGAAKWDDKTSIDFLRGLCDQGLESRTTPD